MSRINPFRRKKKSRRYPIQRDVFGDSLRKRSFDLFNRGLSSREVSDQLGMSLDTARRYYYDWKKLPRRFGIIYSIARQAYKGNPKDQMEVAKHFADYLKIPVDVVLSELEQPWGLHGLLSGRFKAEAKSKTRTMGLHQLYVICRIVYLLNIKGVSPQRLHQELDRLEQEAAREIVDLDPPVRERFKELR